MLGFKSILMLNFLFLGFFFILYLKISNFRFKSNRCANKSTIYRMEKLVQMYGWTASQYLRVFVGGSARIGNKEWIFLNKFLIQYDPIAYQCMEEWINTKVSLYQTVNIINYCRLLFVLPYSINPSCARLVENKNYQKNKNNRWNF